MKILFVCTGNTCRSPLAQAITQKALDNENIDAECESAGLFCGYGEEVSENSRKIIQERGIFYTHQSRPVTQPLLDSSDMVICMTSSHKEALAPYVPAEKLFEAMDPGKTGLYLPFGWVNGRPSPYQKNRRADAAKFGRIERHLDGLVTGMGEKLYGGRIEAAPLIAGRSPCQWCDYGFICCHEAGSGERLVKDLAPAKPFEETDEQEEEP